MASSYSDKDLLNDIKPGFKNLSDPESKNLKTPEILTTGDAPSAPTEEEFDYTSLTPKRQKIKKSDEEKEENDNLLKEIAEAEKNRSPWENAISPRSLRSKVISYQANSFLNKVKPITCSSHPDTLMFPMLESGMKGERVVLRCSVVTCLHRVDLDKDIELINLICNTTE